MGNLEYMASVIRQTAGGDLLRIETAEDYPLDHETLVDQAAEEQDENARPERAFHLPLTAAADFPIQSVQ